MTKGPDPISCPNCASQFIPADQALQQCPTCQRQFFIPIPDETSDDDETQVHLELEQRFREAQDRLNQKHIRIVQLEKRALYRKRTWMLVLAMGMFGLAGQVVWRGVEWFSIHPWYALAYLIVASGLMVGSVRFFAQAGHYSRLAREVRLPEPTEPPDFSTLSDGSQIVENLNRMTLPLDDPTRQAPDDSK